MKAKLNLLLVLTILIALNNCALRKCKYMYLSKAVDSVLLNNLGTNQDVKYGLVSNYNDTFTFRMIFGTVGDKHYDSLKFSKKYLFKKIKLSNNMIYPVYWSNVYPIKTKVKSGYKISLGPIDAPFYFSYLIKKDTFILINYYKGP